MRNAERLPPLKHVQSRPNVRIFQNLSVGLIEQVTQSLNGSGKAVTQDCMIEAVATRAPKETADSLISVTEFALRLFRNQPSPMKYPTPEALFGKRVDVT